MKVQTLWYKLAIHLDAPAFPRWFSLHSIDSKPVFKCIVSMATLFPAPKKPKVSAADKPALVSLGNVIVQFQSASGEETGTFHLGRIKAVEWMEV